MTKLVLLLCLALSSPLFSAKKLPNGYACWSTNYQGQCYDCFYCNGCYNFECHLPSPSVIVQNANIYTVQGDNWMNTPEEAMVLQNGKIEYVGSTSEARRLYFQSGRTRVLDLQGSTVLPGLHDVHQHPLEASSELGMACELERDTPVADLMWHFEKPVECQRNKVGTDWVLGHGHSIHNLLDYVDNGGNPRTLLDSKVSEPTILMEETSHSAWVNSAALQRYEQETGRSVLEDANGAIFMRDPVSNEPNGIVLENAVIAMMNVATNPKKYRGLARINDDALLYGLEQMAKNGITSIVDARCYWEREHNLPWEKAASNGRLTVKAILSMWAYPEKEDGPQISKLRTLYKNDTDSRLRATGIKVYMDGLLGTRTASVLDDYLYPSPDLQLGNRGMEYFTKERLQKYLSNLQDVQEPRGEGFDFLIHAIGDKAVRDALDAIRDSSDTYDRRHRLTHVEMIHPDDIKRFRDLGVIADPQVANDFSLPTSDSRKHEIELIGADKAAFLTPVAALRDSGATVTLSSDFDVGPLSPFIGMANAINRADQSVSIKDAVEMYTRNAAFAMRQERSTGTLESGKDADFIVLDRDPVQLGLRRDLNRLKKTKVLMTVVEGQEIFISDNF